MSTPTLKDDFTPDPRYNNYIDQGDKVKIFWRGKEYTIGIIQHIGPMYAIMVTKEDWQGQETKKLLYINPNSNNLDYIELLEKANDR